MMLERRDWLRIAIFLALLGGAGAARAGVPAWLPRYDVNMDVDVAGHNVPVQMRATWTNPHPTPTDKLDLQLPCPLHRSGRRPSA